MNNENLQSSGYKRTPNVKCEVCEKPLYRRSSDLKKYNGVCCKGCRSEYMKRRPPSKNLELGRQKGTNHLRGIPKSDSHKNKMQKIMKDWCINNPDSVKNRGEKIRGVNHYKWKGGITSLNQSIRRLTENRKWADAVKKRDGRCTVCGTTTNLEADHKTPLATLIEVFKIKNVEDARKCKDLWDISNGITLCSECHCKKDNRKYNIPGNGKRSKKK